MDTHAVDFCDTLGGLEAEFDVHAGSVLGTGMSGDVRLAKCRADGTRHAVKTLRKSGVSWQRQSECKSEVDTHLSLDHPHIARLERVIETDEETHMIMEHLEGGEVFDRLAERERFPEGEAADTLRQVLWALSYLHSRGLAHRDLKLENLLYERKGGKLVKIIDFGFATRWSQEGVKMTKQCGTLHYVAPEVLGRSYDEKADLWSLGVVTYMLLCGTAPWSSSDDVTMRMIQAGAPRYSPSRFEPLSQGAKDFVRSLLSVDALVRPSARAALDHPWLCAGQAEVVVSDSILLELRAFSRPEPFSVAEVAAAAAGILLPEDLARLRSDFRAMDKDLDGVISPSDLALALAPGAEGTQKLEWEALFAALDLNGDREITYSKFISAATQGKTRLKAHDHCRDFDRFDEVQLGNSEIEELHQQSVEVPACPVTEEEHLSCVLGQLEHQTQAMVPAFDAGVVPEEPQDVPLVAPPPDLEDYCCASSLEAEDILRSNACPQRPMAASTCFDVKRLFKSAVSRGQKAKNSFVCSRSQNSSGCRHMFRRPQMAQSFLGHSCRAT